jgi:hypothetical protein
MSKYEQFAKASYGKTPEERAVNNYTIDPELSNDDRVVYKHQFGTEVVIAFRGTDPSSWKDQSGIFSSRGFRDITTDLMMGINLQHFGLSSRFNKSSNTVERAISKYGKENVHVTGHSLGGSQAMFVSKKYDLDAEAYNPFVHPGYESANLNKYNKLRVVHNVTDPISTFTPSVRSKKTTYRYNWKKLPTIFQHGL